MPRLLSRKLVFSERCKKPLRRIIGIPLFYDEEKAVKKAEALILDFNPPAVTTVGDVVTTNFAKHGIEVNVAIMDLRTRRKDVKVHLPFFPIVRRVENPPSTLMPKAWEAVCTAYTTTQPTLVLVTGEEDLLAFPAVICAPENTLVFYGYPWGALVALPASPGVKKALTRYLESCFGEGVVDREVL